MRARSLFRLAPVLIVLVILAKPAYSASWNGIEPLKSRRADLERVLGKPSSEGVNGTLRFSVAGGSALVSFVDEGFVTRKRLRGDLVGTVLEIVLQHDASSDTAESMGLTKNPAFDREEAQSVAIFRNLKEGIVYTFLEGKLRSSRFTFSTDQYSRARKR